MDRKKWRQFKSLNPLCTPIKRCKRIQKGLKISPKRLLAKYLIKLTSSWYSSVFIIVIWFNNLAISATPHGGNRWGCSRLKSTFYNLHAFKAMLKIVHNSRIGPNLATRRSHSKLRMESGWCYPKKWTVKPYLVLWKVENKILNFWNWHFRSLSHQDFIFAIRCHKINENVFESNIFLVFCCSTILGTKKKLNFPYLALWIVLMMSFWYKEC